jgi:hypothetical protein
MLVSASALSEVEGRIHHHFIMLQLYEQARSDWDIIHPGRNWADRLKGSSHSRDSILAKIAAHLQALKKS